jgi:glycosyltransferase involved in cell wall biosynthesis
LTNDTIKTLKDNAKEKFELIIVDNGSPIHIQIDCDQMIRTSDNKGNGAGWNIGLRHAMGDNLMLSDNDVCYKENWQNLANFTKNTIVFPQTATMEDPIFKNRLAGFSWMMSEKTYRKLGDIDTQYGLANFEDTDYFMRAIKHGIDLQVIEDIKAVHWGRKTCDKIPEVKNTYERNKKIYEDKYKGEYPYLTK